MIRTVNVKGESIVKGGKCTTERKRPRPHTVTLHDASTLGKLEIRSGLKPLISDYTTLLGNSLPKDMVHSRLLRYYLPSPTNSNYSPYGRYTMCSTPPSYLLIAPLNHMVSPSHLCLPMSLIMKKSMKSKPSSLTRAPIAKDCT